MFYNEQIIRDLFYSWAQVPAESINDVEAAGSNRHYFRIAGGGRQAIATFGANRLENKAFFAIGRHAHQQGVKVPAIYAIADDELHYLQEDVGDTSLFDLLGTPGDNRLLKKTLEALAFMQVKGLQGFDYTQCYPVANFDRQSIFWDLNYFKYNFLKLTTVAIDELRLEEDFNRLADYLLTADGSFFMYRDFQSRNVMIQDGEIRFIDFQGGRHGPLAYDPASFLFQARANFSEQTRESLFQHYLNTLEQLTTINKVSFTEQWYAFAFFKSLQNLGTYGYRGIFEQKKMFTQSITQTIDILCNLINGNKLKQLGCDYLFKVLNELQVTRRMVRQANVIARRPKADEANPSLAGNLNLEENTELHRENHQSTSHSSLSVTIHSFSYKKGYPRDESGNGGGFVFDCRCLNNPGRLPEFADLSGRNKKVIDFLENESATRIFLQHIFDTLDIGISNYIERGFTHLSVAFGCTGGQHRSVYCAEQTAKYLVEKYKMNVRLVHREQYIEQIFTPEP